MSASDGGSGSGAHYQQTEVTDRGMPSANGGDGPGRRQRRTETAEWAEHQRWTATDLGGCHRRTEATEWVNAIGKRGQRPVVQGRIGDQSGGKWRSSSAGDGGDGGGDGGRPGAAMMSNFVQETVTVTSPNVVTKITILPEAGVYNERESKQTSGWRDER